MRRIYLTDADEVLMLRNAGVMILYGDEEIVGERKVPWLYSSRDAVVFSGNDGRHMAETFVKDRCLYVEIDDEQDADQDV